MRCADARQPPPGRAPLATFKVAMSDWNSFEWLEQSSLQFPSPCADASSARWALIGGDIGGC